MKKRAKRPSDFYVFPLPQRKNDSPPPIPASVGNSGEVLELFAKEIDGFHHAVGTGYPSVPFCFSKVGCEHIGDFTSKNSQSALRRIRLRLHSVSPELTSVARSLQRFACLARGLRFPKSEVCACLRGLSLERGGNITVTIGPAPYHGVFQTMNAQGLCFEVTMEQLSAASFLWGTTGGKELGSLSARLKSKYGLDGTIRRAIHRHCGGLPDFSSVFCSYVLGTAAVILTTDGFVIFGRRTSALVSVNAGVNVPTSGGLIWDSQLLEDLGFYRFVEAGILRELREETGIKGSACAVAILALVRELARAGSPEILAVIEFFGTLRQLVKTMKSNSHPEQDIDAIFAIPLTKARRLIRTDDVKKILHPKVIVTMIMLDRWLNNH